VYLSEVPRQEINKLVGALPPKSGRYSMTTELDVQSAGSEPVDDDVCGACGHTGLSHDAIAKRYCGASRDRALDRACVCTIRVSLDDMANEHAGSTVGRSDAPMYGRGRLSRT
jgi:hypothetical protein